MPKVTWIIDGDTRPLERKIDRIDQRAEKTGKKFENLGEGDGLGGGGRRRRGRGGGGGLGFGLGGGLAGVVSRAVPALAIGSALAGLTKLGGSLEQTRVTYETFLGSSEAANKSIEELSQFANVTPFKTSSVLQAGKSLLAFGESADGLTTTLGRIGNIAAGTGKDFNELTTIYGKARVAGTLFAEDINQLTEAGVPIIDEFAKILGVQTSEVKKLASQGKITFPLLEKAFANLTEDGGKFQGLLEAQANTFEGKLSTALGKLETLGAKLGEKILPALNAGLDVVIGGIDALGRANFDNITAPFEEIIDLFAPIGQELRNIFSQFEGLGDDFSAIQAVIDTLAVSFRVATLPLRIFLRGLGLLIQAGEEIKTAFFGVGDILGGLATRDFARVQRGFDSVKGASRDLIQDLATGFGEFVVDEAKKAAEIVKNFGRTSTPETQESALGASGGALAANTAAAATAATGARRSGVGGGISGGANLTNFEITIQRLVENVIFENTGGESEAELQEKITEVLVGAVNNVQRLAGN